MKHHPLLLRVLIVGLHLCVFTFAQAQSFRQPSAAEIKLKLKKLNVLGTVLYVAAHPDDENTRSIGYFANERMMYSGYLSMTRGDGGQNLIGSEIRDELGLIRTQELLAARRIDGGIQFFTRANDFGFSKSATETLTIWDKPSILSDVVRVIRQFKPDVIITRFPPDERAGHGHHTSSAMLALEAFDIANDASRYPELAPYGTWQPKRIYINTGRWWNQTINEKTPGVVTVDMGGYNALLGESYSELAARSRTMHKSQGFGSQGRRGEAPEYFEYGKGDKAEKDLFDGINTSWTRVKGGEKIQPLVDKLIRNFNEDKPAESVSDLVALRKQLLLLEDGIWKSRKLAETDQLIQACLGLFADATADHYYAAPGQSLISSVEVINRSAVPVQLERISAPVLGYDSAANISLGNNRLFTFKGKRVLSAQASFSSPYWLRKKHQDGLFVVEDPALIGTPQNKPAVEVSYTFNVLGERIEVKSPLLYKWTDPVKGELWRPFEITPPVFVNLPKAVYVFGESQPKEIQVTLRPASGETVSGIVRLEVPEGWQFDPEEATFALSGKSKEQVITFKVTPPAGESLGTLKAEVVVNGIAYSQSLQQVDYDHIPMQTMMPAAEAKLVRIAIEKRGHRIGYIRGAGDEIPEALQNMGFQVIELKDEDITAAHLSGLDAVVLGIRTFNTNERIGNLMPAVLDYAKAGGTVVVQYNTNFGFDMTHLAPYPLTLSRDRVTEENSEMRILLPEHPALTTPNKITAKDFEGWVQERGLYYPSRWDANYQAPLSANDTGESPKDGGLLVAKFGKGYYVYTGLSFFRELPEGVPGAYRLFANLVSLKEPEPVVMASPEPQGKKSKKKAKR
ncbi:MAG: PIG-L family deacetylase [Cyclobacteriaceae bacterium]